VSVDGDGVEAKYQLIMCIILKERLRSTTKNILFFAQTAFKYPIAPTKCLLPRADFNTVNIKSSSYIWFENHSTPYPSTSAFFF